MLLPQLIMHSLKRKHLFISHCIFPDLEQGNKAFSHLDPNLNYCPKEAPPVSSSRKHVLSTVACKPSVTLLISKANPEQLIFLQWTLSKYCHGMWVQFLEESIYYLVCKMNSVEVSSTQIIPVHKSGDEVLWSQWRAACLLGLKSLVLLMWMGILLKLSAEPGVWSSLESLWSSSLYAALYPEAWSKASLLHAWD